MPRRADYGDPRAPMPLRERAADSATGRRRLARARGLRSDMSLPEVLLWERLRAGRLGWKFRRQHAVGVYVVDFYCHALGLVVEVDGQIHLLHRDRDAARDEWMRSQGLTIRRLSAEFVLADPDHAGEWLAQWIVRTFPPGPTKLP